jgi:uncharacterized protein
MKNFRSIVLVALLTTVASFNVNTASFDCAKASTVVEGSICANAALSALDEQLAAAYGRARSSSPNPDALRSAQLDWMKQRNTCGANVECLTNSYKLRIGALAPSPAQPPANPIQTLNGNWYSAQWKYGYTLHNGVGTATSTNSPNFQVGQKIIQLTPTAPNKFSGQQIYTDGKFYSVTATLQPDGSLYFEGDKNVKWTMARVGEQRTATPTPQQTNSQNNFAAVAVPTAPSIRPENYPIKILNIGLGANSLPPCQPKAETYVDLVQKPVRIQLECSIGSDKDSTTIVFSANGQSVVRVIRTQFFTQSDLEPDEILNAAIRFYGIPTQESPGNWVAHYGNAFTIKQNYNNGRPGSAEVISNDRGVGLLIKGTSCGFSRQNLEKCRDAGNSFTRFFTYELIDRVGYQQSIEDGKGKLMEINKSKAGNQRF